jgi:hypothetical protein
MNAGQINADDLISFFLPWPASWFGIGLACALWNLSDREHHKSLFISLLFLLFSTFQFFVALNDNYGDYASSFGQSYGLLIGFVFGLAFAADGIFARSLIKKYLAAMLVIVYSFLLGSFVADGFHAF